MAGDLILSVASEALWIMLFVSAPPMAASLLVGLLMAVVQGATQIQESALCSVPKLAATIAALVVTGPILASRISTFVTKLLLLLPEVSR